MAADSVDIHICSKGDRNSHSQSFLWLGLPNKNTLVKLMENVFDPIGPHGNNVKVHCALLQVTVDFLILKQDFDQRTNNKKKFCQ